jgi:transposase
VKLQLAPEALALLTDGIDLHGAKMRPWYERAAAVEWLQEFD